MFQHLGKKGESLLIRHLLPISQYLRAPSRHSPCIYMPPAASASVTTNDTLPVITDAGAAGGV
jgi:hypothetical protein